jgi:hypothetical protein
MTTGLRVTQGSPDYFGLVDQVTSMVTAVVPPSKTVLVVSKGDENLLRLGSRTGWHFPRTEDGRYAGHYPADSDDAVRQLELLRERGAGYLVFPATSMWWLDHYPELGRHLEERATCLVRDEDTCAIFDLTHAPAAGSGDGQGNTRGNAKAASPNAGRRATQLSAFLDNLLPRDATVAVAGHDGGTVELADREVRGFQAGELETLFQAGVEFLVIPREARLIRDHPDLLGEVEERHRCIARQRYLCSVYELAQVAPGRREKDPGAQNKVPWWARLPFLRRRAPGKRG